MKCLVCENYENDALKKFSDHLRKEHNLNSFEYTIQYLHAGKRPTCIECGALTRFSSYSFKEYCKDHARLAMSKAGKIGGKVKRTWSKGKSKADDPRIAAQALQISGDGNPFFGKKHSQETRESISASKTLSKTKLSDRLKERSDEFELVSSASDYFSRQRQYLLFRCVVCKTEQEKTLQAFERGSRCYKCHPVGVSNWELEVFDFVSSIEKNVESGNRTAIKPKELDIYVPEKNFAIECHGLYAHSEASPRGIKPDTHSQKREMCENNNIRLMQVFWDEWRDKPDIIKSMIKHRLGLSKTIGARKCKIAEVDWPVARDFFEQTHIAGSTKHSKCFGLFYADKLVAAISLRIPQQKKYINVIEIARFSTLSDFHVQGGLSKLMNHVKTWAVANGYVKILTYVDRRIGNGLGYERSGFVKIGETGVDYWYTDGILRYNRLKFRATEGKSEQEVAKDAKVSRIYGCGSWIYELCLL